MQSMVVSISSDKAVWDAVMNNKTVQELKKTFLEGIFQRRDPKLALVNQFEGINFGTCLFLI